MIPDDIPVKRVACCDLATGCGPEVVKKAGLFSFLVRGQGFQIGLDSSLHSSPVRQTGVVREKRRREGRGRATVTDGVERGFVELELGCSGSIDSPVRSETQCPRRKKRLA